MTIGPFFDPGAIERPPQEQRPAPAFLSDVYFDPGYVERIRPGFGKHPGGLAYPVGVGPTGQIYDIGAIEPSGTAPVPMVPTPEPSFILAPILPPAPPAPVGPSDFAPPLPPLPPLPPPPAGPPSEFRPPREPRVRREETLLPPYAPPPLPPMPPRTFEPVPQVERVPQRVPHGPPLPMAPRPAPPPEITGYVPTPTPPSAAPPRASPPPGSFMSRFPRAPADISGFRPAWARAVRGLMRSPYAEFAGLRPQPLAPPPFGRFFQPGFEDEEERLRALAAEGSTPAFLPRGL